MIQPIYMKSDSCERGIKTLFYLYFKQHIMKIVNQCRGQHVSFRWCLRKGMVSSSTLTHAKTRTFKEMYITKIVNILRILNPTLLHTLLM